MRVVVDAHPLNHVLLIAGIYYPPTSLKARLCIKGKHLLYDFCKSNSIPYSNIGKWIIATSPAEEDQLDKIWRRAKDLDVPVHFLSPKEALAKEPNVKSSSVLVSPTTGIVDSHALMSCLEVMLMYLLNYALETDYEYGNRHASRTSVVIYFTIPRFPTSKNTQKVALWFSLKDRTNPYTHKLWLMQLACIRTRSQRHYDRPPKSCIFQKDIMCRIALARLLCPVLFILYQIQMLRVLAFIVP